MTGRRQIGQLLLAFCFAVLGLVLVDKTQGNAQSSVDYVFTNVPGSAVELNSTFDIVVEVQAGSESIAGAEIYLDFDPTVLNVTGLTPGPSFQFPLVGPTFDNSLPTGTIDYGGGSVSNFPTGTFTLITISFEAIGVGTTAIDYSFTFPRETKIGIAGAGEEEAPNTASASVEVVDSTVAVTLGWFLAEREEDLVNFRWQTITESGTAGFNILAETKDGTAQINETLIPSPVIDSVEVTDYDFSATTSATVFYIEEVEISGKISEYGPFAEGAEYGVYSLPSGVELTEQIWLPLIER